MRHARSAVLLACVLALEAAGPPDSAAAALAKIQAGDFRGAAAILRPLTANSPARVDLWNMLGICESELGDPAAARSAFEKGLKLDRTSVSLNENLGNLLYRQGDYSAAKKFLSKAVSLGSTNPGVAFSLAASRIRSGEVLDGESMLLKLEPALADQPDYWIERGWVELARNPDTAAACFDRALALAPDDLRALNGAASAAEAHKDDEKALSYLLRATKVQPGDVPSLLHFGALCLRRDLTIDARQAIERAYQSAPKNNLALFLYARVQIAFQQWQHAHDLFTEFDQRVPGYAPAQHALGWLDGKLNRPDEARRHLERSNALDPSNADVLDELGELDLDEGKVDAAETRFRAALEKVPAHVKANTGLGDVLLRRGDLPGARAHYEAAIQADSSFGPAHYKLSTVLMRLHETDRAQQERTLGTTLNAEAAKASKTVLVLADPDGRLLSGAKQ